MTPAVGLVGTVFDGKVDELRDLKVDKKFKSSPI